MKALCAGVLAVALAGCSGDGAPSGPPVGVRFVHDLRDARLRADLELRPQLTLRYVAAAGEYERGADAGAVTFTYPIGPDAGPPPEQAHEAKLPAGPYRIEACLDVPGGDGCKQRPADYLASADVSGNTRFRVPPGGGTVVVRWGTLNPSLPDAAPPDAPLRAATPSDAGAAPAPAAKPKKSKKKR